MGLIAGCIQCLFSPDLPIFQIIHPLRNPLNDFCGILFGEKVVAISKVAHFHQRQTLL